MIPRNRHLLSFLDEITISIDSIDSDINEQLGRGFDHFKNVCNAIDVIKQNKKDAQVNINSVVTKINTNYIKDISTMFDEWGIRTWRVFRFCPLRGTAKKNRALFIITDEEFAGLKESLLNIKLTCNIQFRDHIDMENGYLLITPKGELCISRNLKDVVVGDMRTEELKEWFL